MTVKQLATLVAALTIGVNLAFAYFGVQAQVTCTVAQVWTNTVAALANE